MRIEHDRPEVVRVTLGAYELATLIGAARWIVEGREGDLPAPAVRDLRRVLASYDDQSQPTRSSIRSKR